MCICAGDFNVQLSRLEDLVGDSTSLRPGQVQAVIAVHTHIPIRVASWRISGQHRTRPYDVAALRAAVGTPTGAPSSNNTPINIHRPPGEPERTDWTLFLRRQRHTRVQIWGEDGTFLSIAQEAEELRKHFREVFEGDAWTPPSGVFPCPPSAVALHDAMKRVPLNKATPPHIAPGPAWRIVAPAIAPHVAAILDECWVEHQQVPELWRDGWLKLMHKASKKGRRPEHYRPLCLSDPIGKAVLGNVKRCGDIRLEAQKAAPSVYERYANRRSGDKSASKPYVNLILSWLQATYHIEHHGVDINIRTTRGEHLVIYADDFLSSWLFSDRPGLLKALREIPTLLTGLRQFGMRINLSKTAMLVRVASAEGRALIQEHMVKKQQGTFLRVQGLRAELLPALVYGATCYGLTGAMMLKLQGVCATHLRSIARLPRHITHVPNDELYKRLHLHLPGPSLQQIATQFHERLLQNDLLQLGPGSPFAPMCRQLRLATDRNHAAAVHLTVVPACSVGVACPHCGVYFLNNRAVKTHVAIKHPEVEKPKPVAVDRSTAALGGLPVCTGCGHNFCSWQKLHNHIALGRCTGAGMPTPVDTPLPFSQQHALLDKLMHHGHLAVLEYLNGDPQRREELLHHCCVCRQWFSDPRRLKTHIACTHKELHQLHAERAVANCAALEPTFLSPCPYCKAGFTKKSRHARGCTVLFQIAFSARLRRGGSDNAATHAISAHASSYGRGDEVEQQASPGTEACRNTTTATEVSQGRQRQGRAQGQRPSTIQEWFHADGRRLRSETQGVDSTHGGDVSALKRSSQPVAAGQGFHPVLQGSGSGVPTIKLVRHKPKLESGQGRRQNRGVPAGDAVAMPFQRAAGSCTQVGSRCGVSKEDHRDGVDQQAGRTGGHVEVHAVGPAVEERKGHAGEGAVAAIRCGGGTANNCEHSDGRNTTEVSQHQAASGNIHHGTGPIPGGGEQSRRPCAETPRSTLHHLPKHGDELRGLQAAPRANQAECSGNSSEPDAWANVRALALQNPGQHCYMNSFAISWIWSML
ncbi:slc47a1 [Symbiodinium necroappetens]|uniref:Slc47a1 protein n=1 Tax=Symbiodinium necroappetens TaxID=1628268 RepID=A0A812NU82_9DINO|nr:slc47a1 [Symbiodinium necroappetens]